MEVPEVVEPEHLVLVPEEEEESPFGTPYDQLKVIPRFNFITATPSPSYHELEGYSTEPYPDQAISASAAENNNTKIDEIDDSPFGPPLDACLVTFSVKLPFQDNSSPNEASNSKRS